MQFRRKQPEVVIDATPWSGGAAAAAAVVDWANNQDGIGGRAIYAPASGGHAEAILLYRGPAMKSQIMKPGQYLTLNHDEDLGERRLVVWNAAEFLADYEPVEAAETERKLNINGNTISVSMSTAAAGTITADLAGNVFKAEAGPVVPIGHWLSESQIEALEAAAYKSGYNTGKMHGGGWSEWNPGSDGNALPHPMIPARTMVDVRRRDGEVVAGFYAVAFNWRHGPSSGLDSAENEIVAWRYSSVVASPGAIDPDPPMESLLDTKPQAFWQNHCGTPAEPVPDQTVTEACGKAGPSIAEAIAEAVGRALGVEVAAVVVDEDGPMPGDTGVVVELRKYLLGSGKVKVVHGDLGQGRREQSWRKWEGGPQPDQSKGLKRVRFRTRDGFDGDAEPHLLHWEHRHGLADIVAWRPVTP